MANYIPRFIFGPEPALDLIFDTPPEGDPLGETLGTQKEQVRSVGGQLFTADFYDYRSFTLKFVLQNNSTALKLKRLFEDFALKGRSFLFYPHTDETDIVYEVELESKDVTFNRTHPDGQGGFLWSFEFSLISVTKTAPRITRVAGDTTPDETAPGAVQNLTAQAISASQISVTWQPPASTGSSPLLRYERRQGTDGEVTPTDLTPTGATYVGLDDETAYTFYLRAVNTEGLTGPWSSATATTLAGDDPKISAVRNLRTTTITSTRATLEWEIPEHYITETGRGSIQYEVEITSPITRSFETTEHSIELGAHQGNLSPATAYTARVRATNIGATETGPWTSINFTTLAAPQQNVPQAPRNVVLSGARSDINDNLNVTFDWPAGSNANTVTSFKIYCYPEGSSNSAILASVRTVDATSITARTDITLATSVVVAASRSTNVRYEAYVVAVNSSGDSVASNIAKYTLERTYPVDIYNNRHTSTGDYVYTADFGEEIESFHNDASLAFEVEDRTRWLGSSNRTYGVYTFFINATYPTPIIAIQPSFTNSRELVMACRLRINRQGNNMRLLYMSRKGLSPFQYIPINYIAETGEISALSAFIQEFNRVNRTRYVYLKNADTKVYITNETFQNSDRPTIAFNMNHYTYASQYTNSGCVVIGVYLYVFQWLDNRIYVYNINTGQRDTSREFTIGSSYLFPKTAWTNGVNIWFLCSSALSTTSRNIDFVCCVNPSTKQRVSSREFRIKERSEIIRRHLTFSGAMVFNNTIGIMGARYEPDGSSLNPQLRYGFKL